MLLLLLLEVWSHTLDAFGVGGLPSLHIASPQWWVRSLLAAGLAIGVVGDAAVRANAQKDMVVGMILILIFAEALGLYGFIIAIVVNLGG